MQKQLLSPRFLQRISAYPEGVQTMLQAPVNRTHLKKALWLLHGSPDVSDEAVANAEHQLLDTMLGKLMVSRRFLMRLTSFISALSRGENINQIFSSEALTKLGDPELPYLWKLREIADANAEQASEGKQVADLLEILAIQKPLDDALATIVTSSLSELIAELILRAGDGNDTGVLDVVLSVFLPSSRIDADAPRLSQVAADFVKQRVSLHSGDKLLRVDRLALTAMAQANASGMRFDIQQRCRIEADFGAGGNKLWLSDWARPLLEQGKDHGKLSLDKEMAISSIIIAWLACVKLPPNVGLKLARLTGEAAIGSWSNKIQGYSEDLASMEISGQFYRGDETVKQWLTIPVGVAVRPKLEATRENVQALLNAFAFIVRFDGAPDLEKYTNIENCVVFDDLDRLSDAVTCGGPRLQRKPVLFIGPTSPEHEDYIITLVGAYWAYGGKHGVSLLDIDYNSAKRSFSVRAPQAADLRRFGALYALAVPAQIAVLDTSGHRAIRRAIDTGLFLLEGHVLVSQNVGLTLSNESMPRIEGMLGRAELEPEEAEALHQAGHSDHNWMAQIDSTHNWAVEHLIARRIEEERDLLRNIKSFLHLPTKELASRICGQLGTPSPMSMRLHDEIAPYLVKLFGHPSIVLGLAEEDISAMLAQARQSKAADNAAASLAVYAHRICTKFPNLILATFAFLTCSVSQEVLHASLALSIAQPSSHRRFLSRMAEAVRRFGNETLLLMLLERATKDKTFLSHNSALALFQGLIGSGQRAIVDDLTSSGTMERIEATMSFPQVFRKCLAHGEREEIVAILSGGTLAEETSFTKWMDELRGLSNELRALSLNVADIPGARGLLRRKLAAAVLSDKSELERLRANGLLDQVDDISAVARNILGDNEMLNSMIAARCKDHGIASFNIKGADTFSVFTAARETAHTNRVALGANRQADAPLISVIISAFNPDLELLKVSLRSILEQDHQVLEVFLVDDANDSEMAEAIKKISKIDARVTYIRTIENSGPYYGRNLAISMSKGAYIAIQDADDWSHPQRFSHQLKKFERNPLLRLVTMDHIRIDRSGCVQFEQFFQVFGDGPMTSMYRRELFDEVGLFASVRSRGDVEMRERIRSYYGGHAIYEVKAPGMLCFADSGTLSQKTKAEKQQALQLFRENFNSRPHLAQLRRRKSRLSADDVVVVPRQLRVQVEK